MKTRIWLVLCATLLISCSQPPADTAKVRAEIEAMTQKAAKDMMSGTVDTTFSQYTDDAISMPANEPLIKGKQALREYTRSMMAMGVKFPKVEFKTMDVQTGGSYAYEVGTYTMTVQMPGKPETSEEGKYLTVYQRTDDGSWKIKVETWNSNQPAPVPPQGG